MKFIQIVVLILGLIAFSACGGSGGDESRETRTSSTSTTSGAESSATGPECLLGSWRPDLVDLAELQKAQLPDSPTVTLTGDAVMRFIDSENGQTDVYGLTTHVQYPGQPPIATTLVGSTNWTYSLDNPDDTGGSILMAATDFQYVTKTSILGEIVEVPVDSETGLFGSLFGVYTCIGDRLTIQTVVPQNRIAKLWYRIH